MSSITQKYQAVNWIDGMKLSSRHFLQSDSYHIDACRDVAEILLNDCNFGLLPPMDGMRSALEIDISPERARFEVILRCCNAVTRGGVRILLHPQFHNKQAVSASVSLSDYEGQDNANFAVVVTANPFIRVPVGEPDPEEVPLRHPHTTPSLRMEIIPESILNLNYAKGHHLVIGKVRLRDKQFFWVDDYLPACAVNEAHPTLMSRFEEIDRLQNALRQHAVAIVDAIYQKAQGRPDYDAVLARNTAKLCEQIVHFLGDTTFAYRNLGRISPPIHLVQQVARLAARVSSTLNLIPAMDREKLLAYFSQWTNIQPSGFLETLSKVGDMQYDHLNIGASLQEAMEFMRLIAGLWGSLSRLEFIGKSGNNLVIGIESEYRNTVTTRHSLLD